MQLVIAYPSDLFGRFPGVGRGGDYPAISGFSTAFSIPVIKGSFWQKFKLANCWSLITGSPVFSYIFGSDVSLGAT
jgi:hypothetical protein